MKTRQIKRLLIYMVAPTLMAVLGYGLLYLAGKPIVDMMSSVSGMVFAKSTPDFEDGMDTIFDENSQKAEDFVDAAVVEVPAYETCYAKMNCDRIELSVPIYFGDSDKVFKNGAGQYMGSYMPGYGKPILIGGHDSTFFAPLEHTQEGDIIKIITNYGNYEYKVTGMKVATASDVSAYDLSQNQEQLILYTCYPFSTVVGNKSQRYFVYADKIAGPVIQ